MPDWKVKAWYFDTLELPFETEAAQEKRVELGIRRTKALFHETRVY